MMCASPSRQSDLTSWPAGELIVSEDRGSEQDRLDPGIRQHRVEFARRLYRWIPPRDTGKASGICVAYPPEAHVGALNQHAHQVRAPVPEPDHRDAGRLHATPVTVRPIAFEVQTSP